MTVTVPGSTCVRPASRMVAAGRPTAAAAARSVSRCSRPSHLTTTIGSPCRCHARTVSAVSVPPPAALPPALAPRPPEEAPCTAFSAAWQHCAATLPALMPRSARTTITILYCPCGWCMAANGDADAARLTTAGAVEDAAALDDEACMADATNAENAAARSGAGPPATDSGVRGGSAGPAALPAAFEAVPLQTGGTAADSNSGVRGGSVALPVPPAGGTAADPALPPAPPAGAAAVVVEKVAADKSNTSGAEPVPVVGGKADGAGKAKVEDDDARASPATLEGGPDAPAEAAAGDP